MTDFNNNLVPDLQAKEHADHDRAMNALSSCSSPSACSVLDDYEIECPYCHMKIMKSEVSNWVGCDACNNGECWLAAQLEKPNVQNEVSDEV